MIAVAADAFWRRAASSLGCVPGVGGGGGGYCGSFMAAHLTAQSVERTSFNNDQVIQIDQITANRVALELLASERTPTQLLDKEPARPAIVPAADHVLIRWPFDSSASRPPVR